MQQLNAVNEGQNKGEAIGVFSGGSDRLIGHNLSFLDIKAPTQRGNDVAIIVATLSLQCDSSKDPNIILQAAKTSF